MTSAGQETNNRLQVLHHSKSFKTSGGAYQTSKERAQTTSAVGECQQRKMDIRGLEKADRLKEICEESKSEHSEMENE